MTKQTPTTPRKKTVAKKVTGKGKSVSKKPLPLTWRFYAVTIGIFLVAVATVVVIGYLANSVVGMKENKERLSRINDIYASLDVGDEYKMEKADIFGEKRIYEWDKSRSYSSVVTYVNADTVSNTVAELDGKIKAAGFTFINEPYPGSTSTQYHYKSTNGEYIRLTVASKPYEDAFFNAATLDRDAIPESVYAMDKNAGPASVTIKVNLDDNNE